MGKLLPKKSGPSSKFPLFEADVHKIIDKFVLKVQAGAALKLATFKDIWRSGNFSFIHQAVPLNISAREFLQLLYSVTLNRLADPSPYLSYRADPSESGTATAAGTSADAKAKRAARARNLLRSRLGASKGPAGEGSTTAAQQPGPHTNLAGTNAAATAATNPSGGLASVGHPDAVDPAAEDDPLGQEYDLLAHLDELIGGDLPLEPHPQHLLQNPDLTSVAHHPHGLHPEPNGVPYTWAAQQPPIAPPADSAGAADAATPGLQAAGAATQYLMQPQGEVAFSSCQGDTDLVAAPVLVKQQTNDVPVSHQGDGQLQACTHRPTAALLPQAGPQGLEPRPLGWGSGPGLAAEDDYDTDPTSAAPGASGHVGAPFGGVGPMSVWASLAGPTLSGQHSLVCGMNDGQHVGQGGHPHAALPNGPGQRPGLQASCTDGIQLPGTADTCGEGAAAAAAVGPVTAIAAAEVTGTAWQQPNAALGSSIRALEAPQGSSLPGHGEDGMLPCGHAFVAAAATGGIPGTPAESGALEQLFGSMSPSHSAGFSPLRSLLTQSPLKGFASPLSKQQQQPQQQHYALPPLPAVPPLPESLLARPEVAPAPLQSLPLPQLLFARPGPGLPPLGLPMQPHPLSSALVIQEGLPDPGTGGEHPGALAGVYAALDRGAMLSGANGGAGSGDAHGLYAQVPSDGILGDQQPGGPTDAAGPQAEATIGSRREPWDMPTLLQPLPPMPPPAEQQGEHPQQRQGQPSIGITLAWAGSAAWPPAPAGAAGMATESAALAPSSLSMQPRALMTTVAAVPDMAPAPAMVTPGVEDDGSGSGGQSGAPAAVDPTPSQAETAAASGPALDVAHPQPVSKLLAALPPPGPDVPLSARVGAIFALYCLYGTQLCQPAVRVYVPLPLLSSLAATVQEAAAAGLTDVVAVVRAMWRQGALAPGGVARFPGANTPRMPGIRGRPRLNGPGGTAPAAAGAAGASARIMSVDIHARRRGAAFNEILVSNPVLRQALLHLRTALPMLADLEGFQRVCEEYGERRAAIFRGGSAAAAAAADGDGVTPDGLFEPRVGGDVRRAVRGMFAEVLQALRRAPAHRVRALERRRQRELQAEREAEEAAREAADAAAAPRTVAEALAEVAVKPLAAPRRHVAGELGALMRRRANQAAAGPPGAAGKGAGGVPGWGPISTGSRHRVVVIRHKSELVSAGLMGEEGSKAQALPGVPSRVLQAEEARRQRVQSVADTWLTRHDQLMRKEQQQQPQPGPQAVSRADHAAGKPERPAVARAAGDRGARPSARAVSGSRQQQEPQRQDGKRTGREKQEPEPQVQAQGPPDGEEDLDDDFDVDAELEAAFEEMEAAADVPAVFKPSVPAAVAAQDGKSAVTGRGRGAGARGDAAAPLARVATRAGGQSGRRSRALGGARAAVGHVALHCPP